MTYMRKHFNIKFIILLFFVTAGVVNIFLNQSFFENEMIPFWGYPVAFWGYPIVYLSVFLRPGLTIALIAVSYRYWHARGKNSLSYLKALTDISLATVPFLVYLIAIINQGAIPLRDDFYVLYTPIAILKRLYSWIMGGPGDPLASLECLFVRIFILGISLAILLFRSKKLSGKLMLVIIISAYLIAFYSTGFHANTFVEITRFFRVLFR